MENNGQPPAEGALADAVQALRKAPVPDGPGSQRNAELLSSIEQAAKQTLITTLKERIRTMKRITRMTVAATLLVGLLFLFSWMFPGNGSPALAFADVAEALAEVRTATCKIHDRGTKGREESKWLMAPGRTRMEFDNGQVEIEDHRKKKAIRLNPDKKLANVWDIDQWIVIIDFENPLEVLRGFVRDIKEGPKGDVEELGTKQIDGRTAVGFRLKVKGKNQDTEETVWADPKTGLPIRFEQIITSPGPSVDHSVFKDFRFNVKLDDSLFDVEPPEGYTVRNKRPE